LLVGGEDQYAKQEKDLRLKTQDYPQLDDGKDYLDLI
jgi:hypothetical protein